MKIEVIREETEIITTFDIYDLIELIERNKVKTVTLTIDELKHICTGFDTNFGVYSQSWAARLCRAWALKG